MVLAVVMDLVPRNVRVTSVALYNFVITNISGLSTTLVPLLRARYDTLHTFRFLAEPLAGAGAAATATATAAFGAAATAATTAAATTAAATDAVATAAAAAAAAVYPTASATADATANANVTDIAHVAANATATAAALVTANAAATASDSDVGGASGIDSASAFLSENGSTGEWSGPVSGLMMLSSSSSVSTQAVDLRTSAVGHGDGWAKGGDAVEFSVSAPGSRGLQAAMLWMYPGMFLASSGEVLRRCCCI